MQVNALECSMSQRGNGYHNALAESFFHRLTVEAIYGDTFETREQMRQQVFEYIEVDYNRARRHSAIGCVSPMMFDEQSLA